MTTSQDTRDALNSLLHETGSCSQDFMLVLATNRAEDIDEAVLDRMVSHGNAQPNNCIIIKKTQRIYSHVILDVAAISHSQLSSTG